jgi:hypothetical protein
LGNVYVSEYVTSNNGYIEKCPITGCAGSPPAATAIFTDPGNAGLGQIIYDPSSTYLYFGDEGQARAYGISTSGASIFQASDGAVEGVATDANYLYFADGTGLGYVNKLTGGSVTRVTSLLGYTFGVAVDPNTGNIWAAALDNNMVASCTRTGTCSTWTWTNYPGFLAVVGTTPYVMTQSSGFYKCVSDSDCTQATTTKLDAQSSTFGNFSYDSNYAYFGYLALLQRCSLSTGCGAGGQNVAQALGNIVWTANDATWVYWITSNGYIQKAPK